MITRIERDRGRFQEIVRGMIRKDLRKYITRGEMFGKKGRDIVSIPLPQIETPRFRFGKNQGGAGQGDGEPGDPLGGDPQPGEGPGAGTEPGQHVLEAELTLEELAQILGEELELPNIQPRGKRVVASLKDRYTNVRHVGPESLRHFKRTYIKALRRQLAAGEYNPDDPIVLPVRDDKMYRSWQTTEVPESNAVIIYMMDVSGSMGDEQKDIVRTEAFWIDTWLQHQYKKLVARYIIHDAAARLVDAETFYKTRESGGTAISSAYRLARELIGREYSPSDWNIYLFHFSDGDNLSSDNEQCLTLLRDDLVPAANLFCYGQVKSLYGSGEFKNVLDEKMEAENLITAEINGREEILDCIKAFLGKGK
jgi:sporulation protein YhbH